MRPLKENSCSATAATAMPGETVGGVLVRKQTPTNFTRSHAVSSGLAVAGAAMTILLEE